MPRFHPKFFPALLCALSVCFAEVSRSEEFGEMPGDAGGDMDEPTFLVRQIRVRGSEVLPRAVIAETVYPFLGPHRTVGDLEKARIAIEEAYRENGYQTVMVEIPEQYGTRGIIFMDVVEAPVGRLRVRGAKFHSAEEIRKSVPSLAEGTVPNFNKVAEDMVAVNGWRDRRVRPELSPGAEPGTVDVDLFVEDRLPLHASLELNNRYSPDTTELRLNASVSYDNLWQQGHTVGVAAQVAPERKEDAEVYSAFYVARFRAFPNWTFLASAVNQDSDVSTLGGTAVVGKGGIYTFRASRTLPRRGNFFHSLSGGFALKNIDETVKIGAESFLTPIEYYPWTASYSGGWVADGRFTEFAVATHWNIRGVGSDPVEFDNKRFEADGSFMYFTGEIAHTHDLPGRWQLFAKLQGQATRNALINSEQFSGGGASTVRGYLESEVLGDSGIFGTFEMRTPPLWSGREPTGLDAGMDPPEWRLHAFVDGGRVFLNRPLPEQQDDFRLWSAGVGTRFRLNQPLTGSLDVAWPFEDQAFTSSGDAFFGFRVLSEF